MHACPNVRLAADAAREWCALAPADHELPDVLHPAYLKERHRQLKPGDIVTVTHEAHRFVVKLYLAAVEDAGLTIIPLEVIDLQALPRIALDWADATVAHVGGTWAVTRAGASLKTFATEAKAREWLTAKRTLAAAEAQAEADGKVNG